MSHFETAHPEKSPVKQLKNSIFHSLSDRSDSLSNIAAADFKLSPEHCVIVVATSPGNLYKFMKISHLEYIT